MLTKALKTTAEWWGAIGKLGFADSIANFTANYDTTAEPKVPKSKD